MVECCRHPVIEQHLPVGEAFVPNDLLLDPESQQIIILTGPNMAGKSALLRQAALNVCMAQMGCFIPAEAAEIGLVDKIFTRVGASDNISSGESTFMVEMTETASIMNNLSDRSLVILDEIGRGTSTYDGISIAWSLCEYLHQREQSAKVLFATHYHELNELENRFDRIVNYHIATRHRVIRSSSSESYQRRQPAQLWYSCSQDGRYAQRDHRSCRWHPERTGAETHWREPEKKAGYYSCTTHAAQHIRDGRSGLERHP